MDNEDDEDEVGDDGIESGSSYDSDSDGEFDEWTNWGCFSTAQDVECAFELWETWDMKLIKEFEQCSIESEILKELNVTLGMVCAPCHRQLVL